GCAAMTQALDTRAATLPRSRVTAAMEIGRIAAILLAATAANLLLQGFEFPNYNNFFHIPIVLDYAGSAEGPHDAFHRSLASYASMLWPLLAQVADEANVFTLFFAIYALNRAALLMFLFLAARELLPGHDRLVAAGVGAIVLLLWLAW